MSAVRSGQLQRRVHTGQVMSYRLETWTDSRHALQAQLRRAAKRGEIIQVGPWIPVRGYPGWFSVDVRRLKDPPPWWRGWAIGAGVVLVVLAALVASMAYVVSATAGGLAAVPRWVWGLLLAAGVTRAGIAARKSMRRQT